VEFCVRELKLRREMWIGRGDGWRGSEDSGEVGLEGNDNTCLWFYRLVERNEAAVMCSVD